MRTETKPGFAVLFAALLGALPASAAAQQCPAVNAVWGETADRMSDGMESAWISNLGRAVELTHGEDDPCYNILSAAHAGAEKASETCGIWWVDHHRLGLEPGMALGPPNTPEEKSAIGLSKFYTQAPANPITLPDLRKTMVHEAAHASLRRPYFRLRGMTDAEWDRAHDQIRDDADICFKRVKHPGLGMRTAGISDVRGTGAVASSPERAGFWGVALAAIILGLAGGWGVTRRSRIGAGD